MTLMFFLNSIVELNMITVDKKHIVVNIDKINIYHIPLLLTNTCIGKCRIYIKYH
jgi:hypothetical protein